MALERDHYQCRRIRTDTGTRCTARATDVDHIDPMTDDHRLQALESLCTYHHRQKSGREGGTASGIARKKQAAAAAPLHPGVRAAPLPPATTHAPATGNDAPF